MKTPSVLFGPMKIPFLLLTPVCVLVGAATAFYVQGTLRIDWLLLALAGGLLAHISVNAINEYEDFWSGLDLQTTPTPFSGGSGALPAQPDKTHWAAIVGWGTLVLTLLVGAYFLRARGLGLLWVGVPGVLAVAFYTRWVTHSPLLCLVAPGLGFGPFMVMGVDFVLTGSYGLTAFAASLAPFFLVNNLLLINQIPDLGPDAAVGRRHLMIVYGKHTGVAFYGLFMACTYLSVVAAWALGLLPAPALLALATAPLAARTALGLERNRDAALEHLIPYLTKNVIVVLTTPVLLAIGIIVARLLGV
ncbi:prenyltransferase [Desulfatitalea alkaliphila]|uniref:Prenyltransferase n=1 Tax=Desulfatitalea alkaliphila TaxID=2929485 RepID=A0AA41UIV7_9BACT|nr:prenyltransferase [Desulfatitalea alkaliphila]MCJ8501180.1 prenyltransferase [Desulfatitalea alkaliphila]